MVMFLSQKTVYADILPIIIIGLITNKKIDDFPCKLFYGDRTAQSHTILVLYHTKQYNNTDFSSQNTLISLLCNIRYRLHCYHG